ncbi:hypothetical protein GIB67_010988 [Kingdonia uniflora]|uniref:Protein FAR1-RELATED SEQUENCE n=1 Tax=Kingdonia uniflora TaxID=39325 RepID=A0A7J7MMN1_9MAGN|nr:hypothetical protein GIB67_010988 [Kingdonia uniflora]
MHNTYEAVEFETKWIDLMKKHKLDDNVWMQEIFNIRQRWIPLWNRETFFAEMSSTGRSESTNNFFNGWLPITTGLYSFMTKYEANLIEVVCFVAIEGHVKGNVQQLTVKSHNGHTESFELQIDLEKLTGNYGCKLFEYVRLPCGHLLKVFSKYDILKIPEAFIMTSHLSLIVSNLFERASKMKESFNFIVLKLDELESYFQKCDYPLTQIDASQQNISTSVTDSLVSGTMILNPLVVQTKGRVKIDHKKGARWKGGMEEAVMKKKRTCKSYGVLDNHDKQTCPLLKMMITESRDNNNGESIQPLHSNFDNHNI